MTALPTIQYAHPEAGVDVAYWSVGRGPALVWVPNVQLSHLRAEWSIDGARRAFEEMARSHTLVRFDPRGGGLSSRGRTDLTIDAFVADLEAVAQAEGLERFAVFGALTGGLAAVAYAARRPERVTHLVLWSSFAKNASHGEAPRMRSLFEMATTDWELFCESISQAALGWTDSVQARQWAEVVRQATTQDEFVACLQARLQWDVTDLMEKVKAPTLVLLDEHNALASGDRSRELAAGIPGARLLVAESDGGMPGGEALPAIRSFLLDGAPRAGALEMLTERETEILAQVATGASNADIAKRLFISIHTVTRHLTHIYAKTGVSGRAQAVRFALEHGLGR